MEQKSDSMYENQIWKRSQFFNRSLSLPQEEGIMANLVAGIYRSFIIRIEHFNEVTTPMMYGDKYL